MSLQYGGHNSNRWGGGAQNNHGSSSQKRNRSQSTGGSSGGGGHPMNNNYKGINFDPDFHLKRKRGNTHHTEQHHHQPHNPFSQNQPVTAMQQSHLWNQQANIPAAFSTEAAREAFYSRLMNRLTKDDEGDTTQCSCIGTEGQLCHHRIAEEHRQLVREHEQLQGDVVRLLSYMMAQNPKAHERVPQWIDGFLAETSSPLASILRPPPPTFNGSRPYAGMDESI
ncbi:Uu.00g088150.m01.CDS01 [Anthostomella pinea]|uniref:Uu.00g088150.m01.CDS01 n=1 Tax=Anthostomella pinea TaxID=933095 RepID=A0AAI8VMG5_9PEZI|nr:Uu.00g088150.m01.CDS01 [Anthostomella pinea]